MILRVVQVLVLIITFRGCRSDATLHVLIYETEVNEVSSSSEKSPAQRLVDQVHRLQNGIEATLFGAGNNFNGFGSKYIAVLPVLLRMQATSKEGENSLVVITDSRDVLINNPYNSNDSQSVVDAFRLAFDELTLEHPSAIIISAEAQCCVSALTHVRPGDYYNQDGSRKEQSCSSGADGCLWAGDDKAEPWEEFMRNLMIERTFGAEFDDAYLNAGLMVGKVKDLIRVIKAAQISKTEDDQAVLTDYMYYHPTDIILDYNQKLFGNNRGGLASLENGGCVFEKQNGSIRLVHVKTLTQPLFLHSPGKFYSCHDRMSKSLGVPQVEQVIRNQLRAKTQMKRKLECNYGRTIGDITLGCNDNATPAPSTAPNSAFADRLTTPSAPTSSNVPSIAPLATLPTAPTTSEFADRFTAPSAPTPTTAPIATTSAALPTAPTTSAFADRLMRPNTALPDVPSSAPVFALTSAPVFAPSSAPISSPSSAPMLVPVTAAPAGSLTSLLADRVSTPTDVVPTALASPSPVVTPVTNIDSLSGSLSSRAGIIAPAEATQVTPVSAPSLSPVAVSEPTSESQGFLNFLMRGN